MITIIIPPVAGTPRPAASDALLRDTVLLVKAEAWQVTAVLEDFRFDPSSVPEPPHTFTTVAGRLARGLYARWMTRAEPIPRTIASDGSTDTTWPERVGVPLFVVEAPDEQRRVYLSDGGFATARFPHRRVEVRRHGKYTTGLLAGRNARAVAEMLGGADVDASSSSIAPWSLPAPCTTAYSLLARTLIAVATGALDEEAPVLRQAVTDVDFARAMDDARVLLTVDAVHAM